MLLFRGNRKHLLFAAQKHDSEVSVSHEKCLRHYIPPSSPIHGEIRDSVQSIALFPVFKQNKSDIEKLRKKYIDNSPEGITFLIWIQSFDENRNFL